ncbi:uncharacterized protein MELLADRAFT_111203 [Melampsora larici-populina 98AG31]|uniref:Uncharacterized protein n=1 Tax=Melampsora larici-populina (strain 98AG31 / pathotype 3-4-7) TaxID=747676 RepID=F4S2D1_MELLP|nr:uncharacterized protein MELLADRAFT_111203 [Melampsora larici-populina 98AG31]EGG01223.1 hypothetical protein MELLADRAFT_111203 [Melampsora larici-populina 98AG31]
MCKTAFPATLVLAYFTIHGVTCHLCAVNLFRRRIFVVVFKTRRASRKDGVLTSNLRTVIGTNIFSWKPIAIKGDCKGCVAEAVPRFLLEKSLANEHEKRKCEQIYRNRLQFETIKYFLPDGLFIIGETGTHFEDWGRMLCMATNWELGSVSLAENYGWYHHSAHPNGCTRTSLLALSFLVLLQSLPKFIPKVPCFDAIVWSSFAELTGRY